MATHSSILAWRIPWTEEPGGLPSMGPHGQRSLAGCSPRGHKELDMTEHVSCIGRQGGAYTCNRILAIKKSEIVPFAAAWMDLRITQFRVFCQKLRLHFPFFSRRENAQASPWNPGL